MKMRKQRLMGLTLVAISVLVMLLASSGTTPEDQDATAAALIGPLGLYMIFAKNYILYDGESIEEESDLWAPTNPGGQMDPLYPYSSPFYQEYRKESTKWQESEFSRPRASNPGKM